jgi:ATP/maltotriose-dependent transcriptional regulator MalT
MVGATAVKPSVESPYTRRIVERTRLLELLDREAGRTIILLAPAGYGKTTLARQWLERAGGAWVAVTAASGDIPVLARDLAAAVAQVTAFDTQRVEIALQAARTPPDQAGTVARTIMGQVSEPLQQWIVLDDYQYVSGNQAAEELIGRLERSGKFRFLVTSRERPKWATSRRRVHLETVELNASALALDEQEVAQLLPPDRRTAELRRQARGWPAVIGLAAHARLADVDLTAGSLSDQLYDYLAEELFECAGDEVRGWLTALAVLPPLSPAELSEFLGTLGSAQQVVATGLAYEADGRIEVHPLAREFLLAKLLEGDDARDVATKAFDLALVKRLYDVAFDIVTETGLDSELERLMTASYPDLIETGRVGTLAQFARHSTSHGAVPKYLLDLIAADLAVAQGSFERGKDLAESASSALPPSHPLSARAYLVAGRASHLVYRFDEAHAFYSRAVSRARTPSDKSDATWGVCVAALYFEDERIGRAIAGLEALESPRPKDIVRLDAARVNHWMFGGMTKGTELDPETAAMASVLPDPWVRSSWSYVRGSAMVLNAEYEHAGRLLRETLRDLGEFGLRFAQPRVKWAVAAAELGRRHFGLCERFLRAVEQYPGHSRDLHSQLNVRALRARMLLAQQQPLQALKLTSDDFSEIPSRAMYGEYLGTRAVCKAVVGDSAGAREAADAAARVTGAWDARVLGAAALAIAFDSAATNEDLFARELLTVASTSGVWDGVVCAIRAAPTLLARLAAFPEFTHELREVLIRSDDLRQARAVGLIERDTGTHGRLTRREREVLEYVALGRRNAEIAASLFITVGTVKRHLDSAYRKLGAQNRTEAITRYAEMVNTEAPESAPE